MGTRSASGGGYLVLLIGIYVEQVMSILVSSVGATYYRSREV